VDKVRARGADVNRCRCGERQKAKAGGCRSRPPGGVGEGKGVLKERDVDGRREVCESPRDYVSVYVLSDRKYKTKLGSGGEV